MSFGILDITLQINIKYIKVRLFWSVHDSIIKENIKKIMQIATFKAVVARRISKRGCEDCKKNFKKIIKILSHEWSLLAR